MTAEVRSLSPAAQAALASAEEKGRLAGVEEGKTLWRPFLADAVATAVQEAVAPLKDQFDAAVTELRAFHASHIGEARKGAYWRGFAVGGVVLFAVVCGAAYLAWRDAQLVSAAGRAIEQRSEIALPLVRCPPGATDPDCLPDTVSRDSGYERPGREPASAGR